MSTATLATGLLTTGASARVQTETFDVTCTQPNVNGGDPFTVGVTAAITLPDEIRVGQEVFPDVSLSLEMPTEVAEVIVNNGYDRLEGLIDASIQIVDQNGTASSRTAADFPLTPSAVPNPPAPFSVATTPTFASYTPQVAGTVSVFMTGDFVTVHDVVVSNESGFAFDLAPFACTTDAVIEVAVIDVLDPAVELPGTTTPGASTPSTTTSGATTSGATTPGTTTPGTTTPSAPHLPIVSG